MDMVAHITMQHGNFFKISLLAFGVVDVCFILNYCHFFAEDAVFSSQS